MNFTDKILKVMNEQNISAYQLEEETGLSHSTISSWKRGTTPTIDKAVKVIKYLGLSADELFETQTHTTTTKETKTEKINFTESELESLEIVLGSLDSYLLGHLTKDCKDKNADDISEDIGRIYNKLVRARERKEDSNFVDPFYSENNIQHLENKMKEYKAGRLQLAEHELVED